VALDNLQPLTKGIAEAMKAVFDHEIESSEISLTETKKEFDGEFTVVVFPFTKVLRKKPEEIAESLGAWMKEHRSDTITDIRKLKDHGIDKRQDSKVLVEYSSPNTNKPLHLGHIRNILLGWSTHKILDAVGHKVQKTKVVNDRGIAICKSMLAWQMDEERKTPESSGIKGDHLVGDYYVAFEKRFQTEYQPWQKSQEGRQAYADRKNKDQSEQAFFKAHKNKYFNE